MLALPRILPIVATAAIFAPLASHADNDVIEHVMKVGFKAPKGTPKLYEKVIDGSATEEESKKFLELLKQMAAEKPAHGDEASWKSKTEALVKATELTAAKDPNGAAKLKEASNCKACHKEHK